MPDTKISAMPVAATLDGTEITPIVQTGANKQVTTANYVSQVLDINPVLISQGGTNITSYTLGDTLYASATNVLSKLAGNTTTTKKFLTQTGTGSVSDAPAWLPLTMADTAARYGSFYFDFSTTLNGSINNNQTTITVVSTSGFSTVGSLFVGAELITYTGKTATQFTGCTRGVAGSQAAAHNSGTFVNGAQTAAANTPTVLQLNTITQSSGVTLNTSTQEISVDLNGEYNFVFSVQLNNSSIGQDRVAIWFAIDGVDVPASTSWGTVPSRENATTPASTIVSANIFLTLTTSNKVTMKWLTDDGTGSMVTYPASISPAYPAAPAVILTVNQVA